MTGPCADSPCCPPCCRSRSPPYFPKAKPEQARPGRSAGEWLLAEGVVRGRRRAGDGTWRVEASGSRVRDLLGEATAEGALALGATARPKRLTYMGPAAPARAGRARPPRRLARPVVPRHLLPGRFGACGPAGQAEAVRLCEANRGELERLVTERPGAPASGLLSLR